MEDDECDDEESESIDGVVDIIIYHCNTGIGMIGGGTTTKNKTTTTNEAFILKITVILLLVTIVLHGVRGRI